MSARLVNVMLLAVAVATSLGVMAAGDEQGVQVLAKHITCSTTGNYTDGSPYERNLAELVSTLSGAASANNNGWFAAATVGAATGLLMCYADCDAARCRECLRRAAAAPGTGGLTGLCPGSRNMSFLDSECVLRYAEAPFLGAADHANDWQQVLGDAPIVGDAAAMNATRWRLLSHLAAKAGHGQPWRLASGSEAYTDARGGAPVVVYGLAQCTGDLAPGECARCLMHHLAVVSKGGDDMASATRGSVRGLSCYLRYQVNDPIDIAGPAAPAPSPQPPADSSGAAAPPTGSTTRVIAGLAAIASSTIVLLESWLLSVFNPAAFSNVSRC